MKRTIATALAVAALLLTITGGATAAPSEPGTADRAEAAVAILDNSYDPSPLTVPVGTTVVWTHEGNNPHTVTADDGSFDSSPNCLPACMFQGMTFEVTLDEPGIVPYYCKLHGSQGGSGMAGVVEVVAEGNPPSTVDSVGTSVSGATLNVTGSATLHGENPVLIAEDFAGDAPLAGNVPPEQTGVDLLGGSIHQPDPDDPELVFEFDVTGLPATGSFPEVIRYGFPFTAGSGNYMIQAKFSNLVATTVLDDPQGHALNAGASFQLRGNCGVLVAINNCGHISWLDGEFDVDGSAVRVTLPLSTVAPQVVPGATIAENPASFDGDVVASYQAYVSTADTQDAAIWESGTTYTVPQRTVRLGLVPAGSPFETYSATGTVGPDGSSFSGSLDVAGKSGQFDLLVEACFGTNCGKSKVRVTL